MSGSQSPLQLAAALTGVRHHPVADDECLLMLFERMSPARPPEGANSLSEGRRAAPRVHQ